MEEIERDYERNMEKTNKRLDEIFAKFTPEKSKEASRFETPLKKCVQSPNKNISANTHFKLKEEIKELDST